MRKFSKTFLLAMAPILKPKRYPIALLHVFSEHKIILAFLGAARTLAAFIVLRVLAHGQSGIF